MFSLWAEAEYILMIVVMGLLILYPVIVFLFFFYNSYILIGNP